MFKNVLVLRCVPAYAKASAGEGAGSPAVENQPVNEFYSLSAVVRWRAFFVLSLPVHQDDELLSEFFLAFHLWDG